MKILDLLEPIRFRVECNKLDLPFARSSYLPPEGQSTKCTSICWLGKLLEDLGPDIRDVLTPDEIEVAQLIGSLASRELSYTPSPLVEELAKLIVMKADLIIALRNAK